MKDDSAVEIAEGWLSKSQLRTDWMSRCRTGGRLRIGEYEDTNVSVSPLLEIEGTES